MGRPHTCRCSKAIKTIMMHKIGIGITAHNRPDVFIKTLSEIVNHTTGVGCKLVVVDDASNVPIKSIIDYNYYANNADVFRFDENVGIARAKNKCLEMLDDCEHIFLFDDDIYPVVEEWWEPYVESGENHLMYIFKDFSTPVKLNDTIELWRNDKIVAYSHARGPMLYLRRCVLDKVGGMDPIFGRWGYEHPDLSNRIFNAGLSSYRYADIIDSHKLFHSLDEHQEVVTNVKGPERVSLIQRNKEIYNKRIHSAQYVPYKEKENVVITTYFTNVVDPQRKECWKWDTEAIMPLMQSVDAHGQRLTIIHDFKDLKNCAGGVKDIYVESKHNPYFQRWISIREYLIANRHNIGKVFCVDATDVVMLNDPFPHMEHDKLYTGDEPEKVGCPWIMNHHPHSILRGFYHSDGAKILLNAGLLGGDVDTVIQFLTYLVDFYFISLTDMHYHPNSKSAYDCGLTDMATFNYIAYTKFGNRLSHGRHVNTKFKAYDTGNTTAWFRHK